MKTLDLGCTKILILVSSWDFRKGLIMHMLKIFGGLMPFQVIFSGLRLSNTVRASTVTVFNEPQTWHPKTEITLKKNPKLQPCFLLFQIPLS